MNGTRKRLSRHFWWLLLFALGYGAMMVSLGGSLYGVSPYHRLQAQALLEGHFSLGDSIDQIKAGLAWYDGHVQQVWGLGIGIWLQPFQAVWHLFGGVMFPDRVALGIAFALLALYAGATGLRISKAGQRAMGLGFIWLVLLCPPLWTLTRASQLIFEETVLYGLIVCLGILVALVRVAQFDSRRDYWLCCALSGFSGLVRPTLAIYGVSAVLAVSVIVYVRRRRFKEPALGSLILVTGLFVLALTNWIRFGSALEFGHRLTISSDSMVYLTRFDNPYAHTGAWDAGKELVGSLFLDLNVRGANAFADNLFTGQASSVRWRRLYLTLFDWTYLVVCVVGIGAGVAWFIRRSNSTQHLLYPAHSLRVALLFWSCASFMGLGWFYLHFPMITSRYLLDFLPSIAGFLILAWLTISRLYPKPSLLMLGAWLFYEIATAKIPATNDHILPGIVTSLSHSKGKPIQQFGGFYTPSRHPADTGIAGNGYGWEPDSGFAAATVIVAVDHPAFLELRVSERRGINGEPARKDSYRAVANGKVLPLREIKQEGNQTKVVFDVTDASKDGMNLIFICFSTGYDIEDRKSERFLYSVRWH